MNERIFLQHTLTVSPEELEEMKVNCGCAYCEFHSEEDISEEKEVILKS